DGGGDVWSGAAGFIRCLMSIHSHDGPNAATRGPLPTYKDTLQPPPRRSDPGESSRLRAPPHRRMLPSRNAGRSCRLVCQQENAAVAVSVPGVMVELDVPVPMRDGTILRADVYRPEEPGTYPVLLIRIPYDKTQAESVIYAHPGWYARNGYIVVCQDTRGRYQSEGEFYPFEYEQQDGYDTV